MTIKYMKRSDKEMARLYKRLRGFQRKLKGQRKTPTMVHNPKKGGVYTRKKKPLQEYLNEEND